MNSRDKEKIINRWIVDFINSRFKKFRFKKFLELGET